MVETTAVTCSWVLPACIILCYKLPSLGHQFSSTTVTGSTEVWENPLVVSHRATSSEVLSGLWTGLMTATQDTRCLLLQRRGEHHGPPWFVHTQGGSGCQVDRSWPGGGKEGSFLGWAGSCILRKIRSGSWWCEERGLVWQIHSFLQ